MKKLWKRIKAAVADNWRAGFVAVIAIALLGLLLVFRLTSLPGGLTDSEYQTLTLVQNDELSVEGLFRDPIFLPYYVGLYLMQVSSLDAHMSLRALSVLFGALGALGFYYVLKKWYSARIALIGSTLFVTSSWFLHSSRYTDTAVAYLLVPLLIACVVAIQEKSRARWILVLAVLLGLSIIYVPGLIWFVLPAVLLQRKTIVRSILLQPIWFRVLIVVLVLSMLSPIAASLIWPASGSALQNGLALLGLPTNLPNPLEFIKNIGRTLSDIFVYSRAGALFGPGHLPWLDACTTILAGLGAIQFVKHFRLDRTKLLVIVGIIGLLLIAAGGPVSVVLLLPFIYLLAVEGLKWLLDTWLSVFPRNPVARSFGVGVVIVLVITVSVYQTQKYFLAWGNAPETRGVFNKYP